MEKGKRIAFCLVAVSILVLSALPLIHPAEAQTFNRAGSLTFNPGENDLASSVIDTAAGFAYFGTDTSPGVIVKVRLSNFTRVASLALNAGEDNLQSAVIDPTAGFAYFGTRTYPGIVVKVRLSDFSRVGSLILKPVESYLRSSVIDPAKGFAYFGTDTSPGIVVKVRLSDFTEAGFLTLNSGEDYLSTSIIDSAAGSAYFGTYTSDGFLVKLRLSDFARIGSLTLNRLLQSGAIDSAGSYAYFGSDFGTVLKVRLSDLIQVGTLSAIDYGFITVSVIDSHDGYGYFGGNGVIAKVRLWDFAKLTDLALNPGERNLSTSVIDPAAGFVYFATYTSPGIVVKLDVAAPPGFDFSLSNSGKVNVLQGGSGSTTINVAVSSGTPQAVSLLCVASTLPDGASCSFNPSSVSTNASSTVTVSTTSATPIGSFQVQVTGNPMGTTTIPTVLVLTVNPAILGLDPIIFYSLIGSVIALAAIAWEVVLRRRHRSLTSAVGK